MKLHIASALVLVALLTLPVHSTRADDDKGEWDEPKPIRTLLVVPRVSKSGRAPVYMDAVEHRLVHGTWKTPKAGEEIGLPEGPKGTWVQIEADEKGWFQHKALQGGYGVALVESDEDRVVLLNARGHRHVYVNGVPRTGDVYNAGITRLPIQLRKGTNELLFKGGRGRMQATLEPVTKPIFFESKDRTLPDVIVGESDKRYAGVIVTNATPGWTRPLSVSATRGAKTASTSWFALPPLASRKMPLPLPRTVVEEDATFDVEIELYDDGEDNAKPLDIDTFSLRTRRPDQHHKRTFKSQIDGSVQYYGVMPQANAHLSDDRPALILSLHGAGVQGMGQAGCYQPKDWAVVVAPTNRRPFGFDWEDWGRQDALEVLIDAAHRFQTDPRRTYLTGHSMGGHGTWNFGAHYSWLFAAIAPSAGWRDFWSYGGGVRWKDPTPVQAMLDRAANVSRTLLLESNYLHHGIYVLHGDKDDNVPVSQARFMRERLAKHHPNFSYYEKPGAGHWWGNQCMDWPPLIEFLKRNVQPEAHTLKKLKFTTINPGINDRCHWLAILRQQKPLEPSTLESELNAERRLFELKVMNVAQLELDLNAFVKANVLSAGAPVEIKVGDAEPFELAWPESGVVILSQRNGAWGPGKRLGGWYKKPERYGTFKDAFRNRVVFVYGTQGSKEQADWAFHKARYDAETFWYRGNGSVEVIADTKFGPLSYSGSNVILYGNQDTNAAWSKVLDDRNFEIRDGKLEVGGKRVFEGDDLAVLFVYPRKNSENASVGVVAGTGLTGMRLTNQIPYFLSGAGFPDWIVYGAEMTELGSLGVRGAGFFDDDWALRDDAAWRDDPK